MVNYVHGTADEYICVLCLCICLVTQFWQHVTQPADRSLCQFTVGWALGVYCYTLFILVMCIFCWVYVTNIFKAQDFWLWILKTLHYFWSHNSNEWIFWKWHFEWCSIIRLLQIRQFAEFSMHCNINPLLFAEFRLVSLYFVSSF